MKDSRSGAGVAVYLTRINAVSVSADDLRRLATAIHELPEEERDDTGRMLCSIKFFDGDVERSRAVFWRLDALSVLLSSELPGWIQENSADSSSVTVHERLFEAAAVVPLTAGLDGPAFDRETLLRSAFRGPR